VSTGPDASAAAPFGTLVATLDGTIVQRIIIGTAPLTIGRLPANRLVLPHPTVSRHHAEVRVEDGQAVFVDVGSASGTFIGSTRLLPNQPLPLSGAGPITIGPYVLTFEPPPKLEAAPPEVPITVATPEEASEAGRRPARARGERNRSGKVAEGAAVARTPSSDEEPPPPEPGRPTWPAPAPPHDRSRLLEYLPAIFQDGDFLGRMLLIYESIWEPLEQRQDHLPLYFDPTTCPEGMLGWLAGWLNLRLEPLWPEARRRLLLDEAMELYRWRGTAYGLSRILEICTGGPVEVSEDPTAAFIIQVRVRLASGSRVSRDYVEGLVRTHKPAHVGYVLEVTT
jgi:phage tail-like protein